MSDTEIPFEVGDVVCDPIDTRRNPMVILKIEERIDFWGGRAATIQDSYGWIHNSALTPSLFVLCPEMKMPDRPYHNPPSGTDLIRRFLNQGAEGFPFDTEDWHAELMQSCHIDGSTYFQSWTVKLTQKRGNLQSPIIWQISVSEDHEELKWTCRPRRAAEQEAK